MKTKTNILFFILISAPLAVSAQNLDKTITSPDKKNTIGIQLNPLFDNNETFSPIIYGIRYGYRISKPLTLGAEVSGSFPAFNDPYVRYSDFKAGLYARYTFFTDKRLQGFIEASPFFSHRYVRGTEFYPGDRIENKFGLYAAPGLSFFTKNRKFSMDLYYKFYVHPGDMYYHENTISYKLNFHF